MHVPPSLQAFKTLPDLVTDVWVSSAASWWTLDLCCSFISSPWSGLCCCGLTELPGCTLDSVHTLTLSETIRQVLLVARASVHIAQTCKGISCAVVLGSRLVPPFGAALFLLLPDRRNLRNTLGIEVTLVCRFNFGSSACKKIQTGDSGLCLALRYVSSGSLSFSAGDCFLPCTVNCMREVHMQVGYEQERMIITSPKYNWQGECENSCSVYSTKGKKGH